jgi:hypothetical protein
LQYPLTKAHSILKKGKKKYPIKKTIFPAKNSQKNIKLTGISAFYCFPAKSKDRIYCENAERQMW